MTEPQTDQTEAGRPFWLGDVSFDTDSGVSHLTGQIIRSVHEFVKKREPERKRTRAVRVQRRRRPCRQLRRYSPQIRKCFESLRPWRW